MELRNLIEDYLKKAKMLQVATAKENQSWACTVYFAFDEKLNIYWISEPTRRHSEEIRNNDKVAGVIVLPHTPGDKVRGIQFQGTARELTDRDEAVAGMKYYTERFGMESKRVNTILDGTDGHVCYKITPSLYVLFDEANFPDNPRQEYKL
ncbi:MAG: Uncharacterized protein G01um10147_352 [Microgenomates group bacterium Gr01-1014_7]|nr:MAG: Uncharacterized protein G01um10147_352 [Microgenomates group bacterium Gr01-1014_7]